MPIPAYHPSPFCHIVIPAPDLQKAKAFYETVFGWRVEANNPGATYWFYHSGNVSGAFDATAKVATQSVVLVLRVADLAGCLTLVVQHGGVMTKPRSRIGGAAPGYDAYFLDPNGNGMGAFSDS